MRRSQSSLKRSIKGIAQGKYGRLLIVGMLALSTVSCNLLRSGEKIDTTLPKIIREDGVEYWCLEKKDFTAVLQEADRCIF